MSDKITGNGYDDSIDKEDQDSGLSNSDDTIFNDDFSDIDDDFSSEDFENPVEEDFPGLDDVETGDIVEDYFEEEFDNHDKPSVDIDKDNEEITSVDDHEFENDEFGNDDFSDISEFDSTPESTAILHEDEDIKPHYEDNSDNWDEDEFSDPINNEDVAITSNGGTVFDDEETPYYNDDYSDEDIEIGNLDDYDEDSGLPWWAWLIIAGVLSGLIAGGAYLYNKDKNGEDSGNSSETTTSVPGQNGAEDADISNSELNALRKELEEKQVELDKLNEEKTQLQAAADDAKNNERTVTETKEVPGPKTIMTTTQRLPAETFTNTETRTLTNTITNTITREAPAQTPQRITVTSTAQAPRSSGSNNSASPRTVTRTTTVTRNNQGRNVTVTRTENNVVTRTNTVYRTTTVTYERYIQQRYS